MKKLSMLSSGLYLICSILWGCVAYKDYQKDKSEIPYLQIIVAVGNFILAILKFPTNEKQQ
ncbi:hypothetical protein [Chakrabartyella piscis]|uniref:hypothetical protein n=1 Tax=Chakrabartyella piscis TaxID=2918914 RepID=UPI0029583677|nr:hypothetical protein [Chakrabartyella piscis]